MSYGKLENTNFNKSEFLRLIREQLETEKSGIQGYSEYQRGWRNALLTLRNYVKKEML